MYKICPLDVGEELKEGCQPELDALAQKHCDTKTPEMCILNCYKEFLELEVTGKGERE